MSARNNATVLFRALLACGLLVIPGLAQWVRRRRGVSLLFLGSFITTLCVALIAARAEAWLPLQVLLWLTLLLIAGVSMMDAYRHEQRRTDDRRRWLAVAFRRLPYR